MKLAQIKKKMQNLTRTMWGEMSSLKHLGLKEMPRFNNIMM